MTEPIHKFTGDPVHWEVTLNNGEIVRVRATAFGEEDEHYVFVLLLDGTPNYEMEVARFPKSAVHEPEGGWLEPRQSDS